MKIKNPNKLSKIFMVLVLCLSLIVQSMPLYGVKANEVVYVGDVDGDGAVTSKDVTKMRRYLADGWGVDIAVEDGDVDGDGVISAKDVTKLRRYIAGGWGIELPEKNVLLEDVVIDENTFPDKVFRKYISEKLDADGNGILSVSEIENVKVIQTAYNSGIENLKGIEKFVNLESLTCSFNNISELDLSKNKALIYLNCGENPLQKLNIKNNTKLETLYCWGYQCTELDLSANTKLRRLDISDSSISSIDLSKNTDLYYLYCPYSDISELDLSTNSKLTRLVCDDGVKLVRKVEITDKVFEDEVFRIFISAYDTDNDGYLSNEEIEVVKEIDVSETDIESLEGIEVFRHLDSLDCSNTFIKSLTFGYEEEPVISIDSIDARYNSELTELSCWAMGIKNLKLSGEKISEITCDSNELEELDVSGCPNLTSLSCGWNSLKELNLSENTKLNYLSCSRNKLTILDLSKNIKLTKNTVFAGAEVEIIWYDETAHQDVPEEIVHQNIPDFADGYVLCYAGERSYAAVAFDNYFGHIDLSGYSYDEKGRIVGLTATKPGSNEKIEVTFEYTGNLNTKTVWLYSTGLQVIWVYDTSGTQISITSIYPNGYTWIQDKDNNIIELGGSSEVQFYFTYGFVGIRREVWEKQAVTDKKYYYNEQRQIVRIDCTNRETNETMMALYEYENNLQVKAEWYYSDGNVLTWITRYDDEGILSEMTYYDTYGNLAEYFMGSGSIDSLKLDEVIISDIEHYGAYGVFEIPYGRNYGYNISSFLGFSGYEVKFQYDTDSKNLVQIIVSDMGSEKVFTADYEYGDIYMSKAVFTLPDGTKRTYVFDSEGNEIE